jgi:hypothetical protein
LILKLLLRVQHTQSQPVQNYLLLIVTPRVAEAVVDKRRLVELPMVVGVAPGVVTYEKWSHLANSPRQSPTRWALVALAEPELQLQLVPAEQSEDRADLDNTIFSVALQGALAHHLALGLQRVET